ncbi:hypothetical protein D1605_006375 [Xylella fastidiosa subsp. fastidiosa]|uniref:Cyanophage baseplate Pam3 plug gp18 domain-containing protein n=3 Tax=Xylella fastidiosa TaxID=2371 RepID=Q877V0_XYLFT|nr:hypothetical protein [Xylella fastidiosa]ADN63958.1 hypothetical protein XFLM_10440 [Xylella fastidiosa subsp. fastidiosa GB514]KAF0570719.1 hypothetical protein P305_11650 [Xylella fastidiosa subsp. fastidiosa Mus-1]AAO28827.1 conserved hypothetical protein [Xylella fastidiosa Temecula1]AAO29034.1 conserved hypothetical protein [Xylella fastidiosa Temecula1]ACB92683.1 conserved hypothetical protein [Xylella fastidiosa M23]
MWQIPVDSSAYQTQSFRVGAESLRLILRWNPVPCCWSMDLYTATLDQPVAQGVPLVVGVPLLWRRPVDYFFWLTDESGLEMDPMRHDDLGERCLLFVGLKEQVRP